MSRLPEQPGERIDRSTTVAFTFDGKSYTGFAGDTIASALYAAGVRVFSRSFKYHRPRGILTAAGRDGNMLVDVDGSPGVRADTEPIREGMAVTHINAWPSLKFDVMRATDIFAGPFTPPGFYYKTFIRPRRLWPLYEKFLRNAAGLGTLRATQDDREWRTEYRRRHCDVFVLGGGIAGLEAAIAAAELGADVVLSDEDQEPGGELLSEGRHEHARDLAARAREAGVEILTPAPSLGFFDGIVPIWQGDTLHQVRGRRHVAATGAMEQPLVFENNDLPGVMLCSGIRRLISLYAIKPGERAVVATTGDRGLEAALAMRAAGIRVEAVADLRPDAGGEPAAAVEAAGIVLMRGATIVKAAGRKAVDAAILAEVDASGVAVPGTDRRFVCDLVAISGGTVPATSLLLQAGAKARYDEATGRFVADQLPDDVHAAGTVAGFEDAAAAALSGSIAGAEAALALGFGDDAARARTAAARTELESLPAPSPVATPPAVAKTAGGNGKCFVDLDEDVTSKDMAYAVDEGFDSIELSKRYTTVTMGPSQGRMSQLASIRAVATETGQSLGEVGITTARPPWSTVPMGALAGRPFEPAKRSSMHQRQGEQGAHVQWAGDWRRAYDYGDPEAEAMAVHDGAGLIDVSTLGKMIVRGPGAGEFLDRLYPNRFANLKPGRVRYGVLGTDAGRITDDGTICRLDDESFYVTTTSSGADKVEGWFTWWREVWNSDVHVTDITQALSAVNLAGPRSREILEKLTGMDCSNEAFAYMDGKRTHVAGVPCLLLRIGFVGELGYEIHFPSSYGEYMWDTLLAAGAEFGIAPFGLEPQRILRLQKMHVIVGQDTDSESNPYNAAMPWIVKLDKDEDFIGKWALQRASEVEGGPMLVGFTMPNGDVPREGSVVVHGGQPGGLVTSSRFSPKLGHTIGMAWVPGELAKDGASIELADNGRRLNATVTTTPFYDPDQERLRS